MEDGGDIIVRKKLDFNLVPKENVNTTFKKPNHDPDSEIHSKDATNLLKTPGSDSFLSLGTPCPYGSSLIKQSCLLSRSSLLSSSLQPSSQKEIRRKVDKGKSQLKSGIDTVPEFLLPKHSLKSMLQDSEGYTIPDSLKTKQPLKSNFPSGESKQRKEQKKPEIAYQQRYTKYTNAFIKFKSSISPLNAIEYFGKITPYKH